MNLEGSIAKFNNNDVAQRAINELNYAELKEYITPILKLTRKFREEIDTEKIARLPPIDVSTAAYIAVHLTSVQDEVKKNPLDVSTYLSKNVKKVSVGKGAVSFDLENKKVDIPCPLGAVGGATPGVVLANITSVASKCLNKKGVSKAVTFNPSNEYAPTPALSVVVGELNRIPNMTSNAIYEHAKAIDNVSDTHYNIVRKAMSIHFPQIIRDVDGKKEKSPILTLTDKRKLHVYKADRALRGLKGEFSAMAGVYHRYQMGMSHTGVKRMARNVWTGVPVSDMNIDHVVALHDAGVPCNSKILVVSSDSNEISLLRANFGAGVCGIGNSSNMISSVQAKRMTFDYIYYPKPVMFNSTGSFENAVQQCVTSVHKQMQIYSRGKIVCHLSPLMFYSNEISTAFGHPHAEGVKPEIIPFATVPLVEKNPEPKQFEPTSVTVFPPIAVPTTAYNMAKEMDYYYTHMNIPINFENLSSGSVRGQLSGWCNIADLKLPMCRTQLSYKGSLLYGGEIKPRPITDVLGICISGMRSIMRDIWTHHPQTDNIYVIQRISKGAAVDNLLHEDTWSAMYSPEIKEEMDAKEDFAVRNLMAKVDNSKELDKADSDYEEVVPSIFDEF
jgi:hypothetical protein